MPYGLLSSPTEPLSPEAAVLPTEAAPKGAFNADYRSYSTTDSTVATNYMLNHSRQTVDFVKSMHQQHLRMNKTEMSIWEAMDLLEQLVDVSDPDTSLPQLEHAFQTAEACRAAFPEEQYDWFAVTGLVHDLGKVLADPLFGASPQWAVVGDTFPVGCAPAPVVVFHEYFQANPDVSDPRYASKCGMYTPGCGLRNVLMSWGHDEYLYQVLVRNQGVTLPEEGLAIIRWHSFYAHHQDGAYDHLLDEYDLQMLPWLRAFQKCDLYSKKEERMDVPALMQRYKALVAKYFPPKLQW